MDRAAGNPFSSVEYELRARKALGFIQAERLDALLCYSSKIIPGNVRYFTGYETRLGIHDVAFFLMVPGSKRAYTLITNASWDHPEEKSWVSNVVITSQFGKEIAAHLPPSVTRLGVAGYRYIPLSVYFDLNEHAPHVEMVNVSEAVMRLRSVKSPAEIEVLRRTAELTDFGCRAFLETARAGMSEREVAAEVEYAMKKHGSDEMFYSTQVGCGEKTSRVVLFPSDDVLRDGEPVQLDCGAVHCGYLGDLSRVKVIGRATHEYHEMLDAVAEMYFAMVEGIRPGAVGSTIAQIGIDVAKSHGLDEFLYRSPNHEPGFMGHGIGCHYCEPPELTPDDRTVLEEGMVLVVEPILMRLGLGGVKIEDSVLVTRKGAKRLSSCEITTWTQASGLKTR